MSSLFMSVPRALHFAFLIQAYPVSPESVMNRIMRMHVEECDIWEPVKMKTIDFEGLSQNEVRAQCVKIREAVPRLLSPLECAAIRARYGLTEYADVEGVRRFYFDKERTDAMQVLGKWAHDTLYPQLHAEAVSVIVARHFASHAKTTPITLRAIAEAFGKSHNYYRKIANELGAALDGYEMRAIEALTPYFKTVCHGHSIA